MTRTRILVLLAIALAALAVAPSAGASPPWGPAYTLNGPLATPTSGSNHFQVVNNTPVGLDNAGDLVAADIEWDGSHNRAVAITRPFGHGPKKQFLSAPGTDAIQASVRVAVAANGDAVVAWLQSPGFHLYAAIGRPGKTFTVTGPIGAVNPLFTFVTLAAGDAGDFAIAFEPFGGDINVARRAPGGGFGPATPVTGASAISGSLAVTPAGETVLAWTKGTTGSGTGRTNEEVDWSASKRGGTFSLPATMPGTAGTAQQDYHTTGGESAGLAVDGSGRTHALVAFMDTNTQTSLVSGELMHASRPAGGTFSTAAPIALSNVITNSPIGGSIWADRAGDLLVQENVPGYGAPVFVRRAGGSFSTPHDPFGGDTQSGGTTLTMGPAGDAGIVYQPGSAQSTMAFRPIRLDGSIGPRNTLGSSEHPLAGYDTPGLAFDILGDGIAAWPDFDGTFDRVRASERKGNHVAPLVKGLKLVPKSFAVVPKAKLTVTKSKPHRGSTIRFNLTKAARVTFTVIGPPRNHCHKVNGHRKCTKTKPTYSLPAAVLKPGAAKIAFNGRIHGKALPPGKYTLRARATDVVGHAGPTATTTFKIVKG